MIRTVQANTVEEALTNIRNQFSSDVTIISVLDSNRGVAVRFHTKEIYCSLEEQEKIEDFLVRNRISLRTQKDIIAKLNSGLFGSEVSAETLISRIFNLSPLNLLLHTNNNPLIFMGYSEVGKTTLALKYAAHINKMGGSAHIITLDILKSGAVEDLRALAQNAGISLSVAVTPQDVGIMCQNLKPNTTVLVDTPSLQERDFLPHIVLSELQKTISGSFLWAEKNGLSFSDYQGHYHSLGLKRVDGVVFFSKNIAAKAHSLWEFAYNCKIPIRGLDHEILCKV